MKEHKRAICAITAAITVMLCACGGNKNTETVVPSIKIGVLEQLSGASADRGKREYLGISYANSEQPTVSINGTEYNIELEVYDCGSDEQTAEAAAQALAEEGVSAVLGPSSVETLKYVSDIFKTAGVAIISPACTGPGITEGNDHCFRVSVTDEYQAEAMASFAKAHLGVKSVYCLGQQDDDSSQRMINAFLSRANELEIYTAVSWFPAGCTDFGTYLNDAAGRGFELIFAHVSEECGISIVRQAGDLEDCPALLGGADWDSDEFLRGIAGSKIPVYVSSLYAQGGNTDFDSGFTEWLGADPQRLVDNMGLKSVSAYSAMGYDAYTTAIEAIKEAASADSVDILAVLPGVNCAGISGVYSFNEYGDAERNGVYFKKADSERGQWQYAAFQSMAG